MEALDLKSEAPAVNNYLGQNRRLDTKDKEKWEFIKGVKLNRKTMKKRQFFQMGKHD